MLQYQIIPVTHYQQNCTLLWCDETMQAAVVDPGGNIERILSALVERKLTLVKILLTHGHLDHVGGTEALVRATQLSETTPPIPIEGPHKDDMFWINKLPQQAEMMGFSTPNNFEPTIFFNDGDEVGFGKIRLQIRHCPGHTPGHIIFFHAESKLALVGDVLFKGSIGRTDFPRGNYDDLVNSIRTKLWPLGDDVQFIPGHGPTSTFGQERLHNAFVADKNFG
ncbi:MAG: MBL fold metallo-hydrolase [Gammaproteobacteria bacterium]|nr:MAG: MBL fold metallo-hydrolase [Gammaproteobacteria bacterium]